MEVKTQSKEVRDQRIAQGEETRGALLAAARELFGASGYAATSLDEIAARAGVTKGAMYHHFRNKADIFRAVFEQVKREVSDQVVTVFMDPDPWKALTQGCQLMIDAQLDPAVRRIALHDARAALEWETVRSIEMKYGVVGIRAALRKAMQAGVVERQPLRPLSLMLAGAVTEASFYIADADDAATARLEVNTVLDRLMDGLRLRTLPPD